jgi:hypothetical protein
VSNTKGKGGISKRAWPAPRSQKWRPISCFAPSNEAEETEPRLNGKGVGMRLHQVDVVIEPDEVEARLAALGLDRRTVVGAVERGEAARNTCTANDPPATPGLTAWFRTVRALRDLLLPVGWKRNNDRNFPTVVRPDGCLRIAVATGDKNVGDPSAEPKTRSPKGPLMELAVARNHEMPEQTSFFATLGLPEEDEEDEEDVLEEEVGQDVENEVPVGPNCETWVLLIRRTKREVRCELSLPAGLGANNRVTSWTTRIVLPSIPREPEPKIPLQDRGSDIDVPVVRK